MIKENVFGINSMYTNQVSFTYEILKCHILTKLHVIKLKSEFFLFGVFGGIVH